VDRNFGMQKTQCIDLCSVYSVCGQSRGYFIASVWDVFRDLAF